MAGSGVQSAGLGCGPRMPGALVAQQSARWAEELAGRACARRAGHLHMQGAVGLQEDELWQQVL